MDMCIQATLDETVMILVGMLPIYYYYYIESYSTASPS